MLQIMFKVIVLVMFSCLPSFTAAETKVKENEKKDELTKIISQQDDARGENDLAKLWQMVAQLEMQMQKKDMNRDEELRKMETKMVNKDKKMERTTKEMANKIRKMEMQMENKDKIVRQLDQKLAGPVEPLAKFLIEAGAEIKANAKKIVKLEKGEAEIKDISKKIVKLEKEGAEIKNNTKKIEKCEKGFCGTCQRPYGAKMIPLKPYLGSHYTIYTEPLVWATARAACANHGGQLASIETNDEWQHIFEELKLKDGTNLHWLGAQKVGGGGPREGWQWLTGVDISKDNPAWFKSNGNGKCLVALDSTSGDQGTVVNDWYDFDCQTLHPNSPYSTYSLCEFK